MAVSQETINKIIDEADIIDIIGQFIALEKKGNDYKGACPFHNDNNPSLSVSPTKKVFKCFSCNTAGNVVGFVQRIKGITFLEALQYVGETIGIKIDLGRQDLVRQEHAKYYEILEKAAHFYSFYLNNSKEGIVALEYLHKRQLNDNIIKRFGIGLASSEKNLLYKTLEQNGYSSINMQAVSLIKDNNGYIDSFRNRIVFPIKNIEGKIIGFSGRIYTDLKDEPKYLNTSENDVFKKSLTLYNYFDAINDIKLEQKVYLFEGFMDVIAGYRSGIKNAVASMGTALTESQIIAIRRLTNNVVICYDGDSAGIEATKKAITQFASKDFQISAILFDSNLDPDDYIKKYGETALKEYLSTKQLSAIEYLYNVEVKKLDRLDTNSIEIFKKNMFKHIQVFNSNTISEIWLKKISSELNISYESLTADFTNTRSIRNSSRDKIAIHDYFEDNFEYAPVIKKPMVRKLAQSKKFETAERDLIALAFNKKEDCLFIESKFNWGFCSDPIKRKIFYTIFDIYRHSDLISLLEIKRRGLLTESELKELELILNSSMIKNCTENEILKIVRIVYDDRIRALKHDEVIDSLEDEVSDEKLKQLCKVKRETNRNKQKIKE